MAFFPFTQVRPFPRTNIFKKSFPTGNCYHFFSTKFLCLSVIKTSVSMKIIKNDLKELQSRLGLCVREVGAHSASVLRRP